MAVTKFIKMAQKPVGLGLDHNNKFYACTYVDMFSLWLPHTKCIMTIEQNVSDNQLDKISANIIINLLGDCDLLLVCLMTPEKSS